MDDDNIHGVQQGVAEETSHFTPKTRTCNESKRNGWV